MSSAPYKSWLSEDELRVVRICPGRWEEPLVASLITCKFALASTFCPYTALSYVWGTSSVTEAMDLDGVRFNVTLNLLCALKHLRDSNSAILLWVDALCINQENETERGQQVRIMQNIYKNAQQVIVFIGDGRGHRVDRSKLTLPPTSSETTLYGDGRDRDFMDNFLSNCRAARPGRRFGSIAGDVSAIGLVRAVSERKTIEVFLKELMKVSQAARTRMFESLRAFVVCPWWARIWVVQEVTVNDTVVVRYGDLAIPWIVFVRAADTWSMPQTKELAHSAILEEENIKVLDLFATQVSGLERTRRRWRAGGGISLVSLLQEFSHRQASDDRDKVYGLLSLVSQQSWPDIFPDYGTSVFDTYRTAVLAIIREEASLTCWCGDQRRKNHRDLPSWVPDWSTAFDLGDRRRMGRVSSYGANRAWNLELVTAEYSYWEMVARDIEQLLNSPVCQSGRLPASLRSSLSEYIHILEREKRNGAGSKTVMEQVISLCKRLSSLCSKCHTRSCPFLDQRVRRSNHCATSYCCHISHSPARIPLCSHQYHSNDGADATENAIKLSNLFKTSCMFRGDDTHWLADNQLNMVEEGVGGTGTGRRLYHLWPTMENALIIQSIMTDCIIKCGSRLLGWADKDSVFSVLSSWRSLLQERDITLRRSRQNRISDEGEPLRDFAETLLGGLCWRNGSYLEAAQVDLSALEDWIRLSLVAEHSSMPPSPFLEDIEVATDGRVFFLTKNGSMGLGPASIQNGDRIQIFPGGRTHFALRKKFDSYGASEKDSIPKSMQDMDSRQYVLIGDCYLHSDGMSDSQVPTDEETAIDGSLPFEFLGRLSLAPGGDVFGGVDTIVLI